jgi:hypothetical protein
MREKDKPDIELLKILIKKENHVKLKDVPMVKDEIKKQIDV